MHLPVLSGKQEVETMEGELADSIILLSFHNVFSTLWYSGQHVKVNMGAQTSNAWPQCSFVSLALGPVVGINS